MTKFGIVTVQFDLQPYGAQRRRCFCEFLRGELNGNKETRSQEDHEEEKDEEKKVTSSSEFIKSENVEGMHRVHPLNVFSGFSRFPPGVSIQKIDRKKTSGLRPAQGNSDQNPGDDSQGHQGKPSPQGLTHEIEFPYTEKKSGQ